MLRFSACYATQLSTPEAHRLEFIINYNAADDTLTVYAHAPHNSGLSGGQFLKKSCPTNPATGRAYAPEDLMVGATRAVARAAPRRVVSSRAAA